MKQSLVTIDGLLESMDNMNYTVFKDDSKPFNLNLIGIRSKDMTPNTFNDLFCILWKYEGEWNLLKYECTTDPGLYWLKNPMMDKGTAILKEGQYFGMWELDYHKGLYEALKQVGLVTVIRDANRDGKLDMSTGIEETGRFGINGHRANAKYESIQVDKWSAACQVLCNPDNFNNLIYLCKESAKFWGNSFTYTLLNESNLVC
jgi:hypothetical protein